MGGELLLRLAAREPLRLCCVRPRPIKPPTNQALLPAFSDGMSKLDAAMHCFGSPLKCGMADGDSENVRIAKCVGHTISPRFGCRTLLRGLAGRRPPCIEHMQHVNRVILIVR